MKKKFRHRGFSLVELIVVISIISVLSVSTVVAFNVFGEALKAKEVAGVITDKIKAAELLVLKGDYQKIDVHFFENYLVLVESPENTDLNLTLGGECNQNGEGHNVATTDTGNLHKKDESGNGLGISSLSNSQVCAPFKDTEEAEWRYQLVQGDQVSSLIRFVNFNIDSDFTLGVAAAKYRLEIEAPYAKKTLYVDNVAQTTATTLTIQNAEGLTGETVTLQS